MAIFCVALPLLTAFFIIVKHHNTSFHFELNHGNHTQVFSYLSNVEHFSLLNPTILSLKMLDANANGFSIEYEERLSHFPSVKHLGIAHYEIKTGKFGEHELLSNHQTCFLGNFFCLFTSSLVRVNKTMDSRVTYDEEIIYSCPRILNIFCIREILFQRMTIMDGIEKAFPRTVATNKKNSLQVMPEGD